jgi:hypothetical protein
MGKEEAKGMNEHSSTSSRSAPRPAPVRRAYPTLSGGVCEYERNGVVFGVETAQNVRVLRRRATDRLETEARAPQRKVLAAGVRLHHV